MRVISGVLLCALFAAACSERLGRSEAFVRDVSLPAGPFSPGDEVTVAASGFESDDEIMFEIRWPLEGEALEEGSAEPYVPGSGRLPRLDGRGAALPPG